MIARFRLTKSRIRLLLIGVVLGFILFTAKSASDERHYMYLKDSINKYGSSYNIFGNENQADTITYNEKPDVGKFEVKPIHQFWNSVFSVLDKNALNLSDKDVPKAIQYIDKSQQKGGSHTKENFLSKAYISEEVYNELKEKHKNIMSQLPTGLADITFKKDTTGVVFVGGGRFSWLSYLSLVALREAGSKLPVEIMMPKFSDYEKEKEFCNEVLPNMNAACVVIPDKLGSTVMLNWSKKLQNYQFKSLALMTSSFQNILLLDSDNIVVKNPDKVFESLLFKKYGMITWPDYWERTISPVFYDIANVKVNELKRVRYNRFPLNVPATERSNLKQSDIENVPFHDLDGTIPSLSTESGQLFIDKATHGKTLLMALYYNIYGPNLYYKLFSLGEQGEGDKDTFVAAATVAKQKFYQVKSFIKTFGYLDANGKFQGVAMGQKDALADVKLFNEKIVDGYNTGPPKPLDEQVEDLRKILKDSFDSHNDVPLFAIHCNYPKLDPIDLLGREDLYDKEKNRIKYRLYGNLKYSKDLEGADSSAVQEIDFEAEQWKAIHKILCERKIFFVHFRKHEITDLCTFIGNQVSWLTEKSDN